ncbi:hypothetical protein JOC34_000491 [Virgibacillus halotolerans]|uniref:hypothetical protein n=1 Tax=Virgibacillus halotolerans TaxID=1071053 RepID=UPI0019622411|nr:hypothetical protein [Virgibacillus halotolerans]MBM7598134.1 hypothetical protein [Virgibacillus halotolerans]
MIAIKCTYSNGDTSTTDINGTLESAKDYFLNQWFNFGDTEEKPHDDMQQCIKVELI